MKIKKIMSFGIAVAVLLANTAIAAAPDFSSVNLNTPGTQRTLFLPASVGNAPVISLGSAIDPVTAKAVEGYAIVHYQNQNISAASKPSSAKNKPCYSFLAKGTKWKAVESWVVNATNSRSLTESFILSNLTDNITKWEDAADGLVGSGEIDILGTGTATSSALVADTSSPEGSNEIYFADISSPGAIAVTIVWGIFGGPVDQRELVEWDQIYDDNDYNWSSSSSGEAGKMDFENIATHELGHSVGLNDLYQSMCKEETMYGYADFGETNKRDLNIGDIAGISALY